MFKQIKRRDGKLVKFHPERIIDAIKKAGEATGEFDEKIAKSLAKKVISLALERIVKKIPTVEQIQDIVEEVLMASKYKVTARSYVIYRDQHARLREILNKGNVDLVDQYLDKLDWQVNENSNMTFSLQGLNNYIAEEVSKIYWLNKIYPEQIKNAYLDGDMHIHDLGFLSVYCVGWDLMDLLITGFRGVPGKIECGAPKHLRAAFGQVVNFFYTLQGESAGAQAFSNFDTLLAPFIRYDNLSYHDLKDCFQSFLFNMNVPTRVGFQTPFTNITLDLTPPANLANQSVIIGGKPQKEKYGDFQKEMDMFNQAFLEVMTAGDSKGRVFTFPIPTYNITKDFEWDHPRYEGIWEMTAKYGVPYFSNFINSDMKPEDARSMCCRLRIDNRTLEKRGGGLFGANPLTGSIGVVTINMPRIGYISQNKTEFFENLGKIMDLAKESLELKREVIEALTEKDLYPYSKFYLRNVKKRFGKYWKNHFSTIGLLGLNEACLNLFKEDIASEEGNQFAIRVLDFMRDKLLQYQLETGNNYNLEATPAEGTSYRLALKDKVRYPKIITASANGSSKKKTEPFYTNSSQLPVSHTDDIFESLDLQDELQTKYTGGTVIHLFIGEKIEDPQSVKMLAKKICENYRLPYFSVTPTFSICPNHGYIAGEQKKCAKCKENCEIYSRVVGYLRPIQQWNKGKKAEYDLRKTYKLKEIV